jgi:hypothetical protein
MRQKYSGRSLLVGLVVCFALGCGDNPEGPEDSNSGPAPSTTSYQLSSESIRRAPSFELRGRVYDLSSSVSAGSKATEYRISNSRISRITVDQTQDSKKIQKVTKEQ